jgi:hypothetical protein
MTDTKMPAIPKALTPEQIEAISGGECTPGEWLSILDDLKGAYESVVDLTSYVIERVATSVK